MLPVRRKNSHPRIDMNTILGSGGVRRETSPTRGRATTLRRMGVYSFCVAVAVLLYVLFFASMTGSKTDVTKSVGVKEAVNDAAKANVKDKAKETVNDTPIVSKLTCPTGTDLTAQYAIMLDAGSTGSRVHVYTFHHCVDRVTQRNSGGFTLDDELFEQVKPGLSSYADNPTKAAMSLDALMDHATNRVPKELWKCTPVAVKATAGLRLIGAEKSEAILKAVRHRLETVYDFNVLKDDGVSVMDGKDEGVFAWITVNYLRKSIGSSATTQSAAIMDLGGGSTQIVFEPKSSITLIAEGDYRSTVSFGGKDYVLYQHSYLGYGLMEGRRKVLEAAAAKNEAKLSCLADGASMPLKKAGDSSNNAANAISISGTGAGFDQCSKFVAGNLFDKDQTLCTISKDSCSWDGVYQPKLKDSFEGDIYAFSYFYDRIADLGVIKGSDEEGYQFTVKEVEVLATSVCKFVGGDESAKDLLSETVLKAIKQEPGLCLDLGFIFHLLSTGYEIHHNRLLKTAKKINGVETGWCLGASIHMLDQLMSGPKGVAGVCRS
ncbi:Guanosine-diphosphatase [Chytriomyces hyalinus]|nr:Guanosine-diphosphatase [Chytriomyces hyalinus]